MEEELQEFKFNYTPTWKGGTTIEEEEDDEEKTADGGQTEMDFYSNGFLIHSNSGGVNTDNQRYVYYCFAEHPFVSSKSVPVCAR